jgi:hypothetical protein
MMRNPIIAICGLLLLGLLVSALTPAGVSAEAGLPGAATPAKDALTQAYLPLVTGGGQTATPPTIASFTANPSSIAVGASSTLTWQVTGATSLTISPDVGAVTGTSITVSPATTTQYTLQATNGAGSVIAQATVTVVEPPPATGGFFLIPMPDIELPTSHPTLAVDPLGGVHVAFTPESAAAENPTRPAYYAYCPANCTGPEAFTRLHLGDEVEFASLALTPAGQPRLLVRKRLQDAYLFQFWQCDGNCTSLAHWHSGDVGAAYARQVGWVEEFVHAFALDDQGRPRFVYYDAGADYEDPHWGAFYAFCDAGCTAAANWQETRLLDDIHAGEFDLAFGPNGQPRLAWTTFNSETLAQQLVYAECEQICHLVANWSAIVVADTVSASVTHWAVFDLAVAATGKPRLALYTGTGAGGSLAPNSLYYLACVAVECAADQAWSALRLLAGTQGEDGVALALDSQDRPRIAYHAPLAAGFGLFYAWCNADCTTSTQSWRAQEMEASEEIDAELPIPPAPGCAFPQCNPPIPPCTISFWDGGVRPALALDAGGHPRIAYDADHQQGGGCGAYTDTKQVRFIQFSQP